MSDAFTNLLAAVLGAIVGGLLTLAGLCTGQQMGAS
jgi:hypothetical protein